MQTGLLRQGVNEAGLADRVRELSDSQSIQIREEMLRVFAKNVGDSALAWDSFVPFTKRWTNIAENLPKAIAETGMEKGQVVLMEERWRDDVALSVPFNFLPEIVEKAWYPSEDIYIVPWTLDWCLVLTHHDTMLFYARANHR
jgi:hypothetical protein